jgi:hypothetical protein
LLAKRRALDRGETTAISTRRIGPALAFERKALDRRPRDDPILDHFRAAVTEIYHQN